MFGFLILIVQDPALALGHHVLAKFLRGQLVTPIAKRSLRKFLNVSLVHQRHHVALVFQRMNDRPPHQPLGSHRRHRLDPHAGIFAYFLRGPFQHLGIQKINQLLRFHRAGPPFDPRVHVFGVFPEDHHVHAFRFAHRRRHAREITHRPHAGIKIQHLAQRHVQRTNAAAHRSRQRPLDRHAKIANRVHRILRQPFLELPERLFPREHFQPLDLALPAVGLLHGRIKHAPRSFPDVAPRAVALDERNHRMVRHVKPTAGKINRLASRRHRYPVVSTLHGYTVLPGLSHTCGCAAKPISKSITLAQSPPPRYYVPASHQSRRGRNKSVYRRSAKAITPRAPRSLDGAKPYGVRRRAAAFPARSVPRVQ